MSKTIPVVRDGSPVFFNDTAVHVKPLTLGGRRRIKAASDQARMAFFRNVRLQGDQLQRAINGDAKAIQEAVAEVGVTAADMMTSSDETALIVAEVACDSAGVRLFASVEAAEELEAEDADAVVAAAGLLRAPLNPTVEQVKEEAGNSAATG